MNPDIAAVLAGEKRWCVRQVSLATVREFIEQWHYSHSVNGVKIDVCFALVDPDDGIVGAAVFGALSTTAWKAYGEKESDVTELRRLVCVDACPKNTETWFLSRCMKALRRMKLWKICVSYADPTYGHYGAVYQAASWNYQGQTPGDVSLVTPDGRRYHSRALRTKFNGRYKPFVLRLRQLDAAGELRREQLQGKHIYTYTLAGVHRHGGMEYPKGTLAHNAPRRRIDAAERQGRLAL